jgi:hypothetical protein
MYTLFVFFVLVISTVFGNSIIAFENNDGVQWPIKDRSQDNSVYLVEPSQYQSLNVLNELTDNHFELEGGHKKPGNIIEQF